MTELTLAALFGIEKDLPESALLLGMDREEFVALENRLAREAKHISLNMLRGDVWKAISTQLQNTSVLSFLVTAWNKYQALARDFERSRSDPQALIESELAEHSVASTLHPYLRLLIREQEVGKIVLDVTMEIKLKGIVLEIQKGKIVALKAGLLQGSGDIKIKSAVILQRDFKPIQLPGRIELDPIASIAVAP